MEKQTLPELRISRRSALRFGAAAAAAVLFVDLAAADATAAPLPPVEADNPTAKALGYVEDATKTDTAKYKQYQPGQHCENCRLLQGKAGDARRPCQLFPGKSVSVKGWCAGWVKLA